MAGITLDAGVLIAIERSDRQVMRFLQLALEDNLPIVVPAAVLAQVWRGDRSARLSQLIRLAFVDPLEEQAAHAIGRLLARARTADIVDASVVVSAAKRGDDILTGAGDVRHLAQMTRGVRAIVDLNALPRR